MEFGHGRHAILNGIGITEENWTNASSQASAGRKNDGFHVGSHGEAIRAALCSSLASGEINVLFFLFLGTQVLEKPSIKRVVTCPLMCGFNAFFIALRA